MGFIQQLKDFATGTKNLFPISVTEAIYHRSTGETLDNIIDNKINVIAKDVEESIDVEDAQLEATTVGGKYDVAKLDEMDQKLTDLNGNLTNENNESFIYGIKDGVRGFYTNPSRADDCFVPFKKNITKTLVGTISDSIGVLTDKYYNFSITNIPNYQNLTEDNFVIIVSLLDCRSSYAYFQNYITVNDTGNVEIRIANSHNTGSGFSYGLNVYCFY